MCKQGDTVVLHMRTAKVEAGRVVGTHRKAVGVDRCVAPIVYALNGGGVYTVAQCCGHGRLPGNIILADGRELIIAKDYDEGRTVDRLIQSLRKG